MSLMLQSSAFYETGQTQEPNKPNKPSKPLNFDVSQGKLRHHVLHLFLRRESYEMPGSGLEILEARGCL